MKTTLNYELHRIFGPSAPPKDNEVTISSKDLEVVIVPSTSLETSDGLHVGNHVLAMPYWSEIRRETPPDREWTLEAYTGKVKTKASDVTRTATRNDWPFPPKPLINGAVDNVQRANWTFNVQPYSPTPVLKLPLPSVSDWALLEELADTKALGNLRKALLNLPMLFAERRETIQLIGQKVGFIAKTANAIQQRSMTELQRTKPRNRREAVKTIANEHLAFVFGILPLIGEVEGAIELLHKDNLDFIRSRGLQVRVQTDKVASPPKGIALPSTLVTGLFVTGKEWFKVFAHGTDTTQSGVRTALRYKLTSKIAGDAYSVGFEPIGTAFDLVPLSFVSGWISNFDYWVRTLSPEIGIEFETGSRNRRTLHSYERTFEYITSPLYYDVVNSREKTHANGSIRKDVRTVLTEAPEATLHWDVEVGLFEVAAGISLTVQRYLKPLKRNIALKQFRYKGPRPKWLKDIRYTGRR